MGAYYGYFIIGGILSVVGMVISQRLKSKFNKYSGISIRSGLSGREVAEQMLRYFGITDVEVLESKGFLTDHTTLPPKQSTSVRRSTRGGTSPRQRWRLTSAGTPFSMRNPTAF